MAHIVSQKASACGSVGDLEECESKEGTNCENKSQLSDMTPNGAMAAEEKPGYSSSLIDSVEDTKHEIKKKNLGKQGRKGNGDATIKGPSKEDRVSKEVALELIRGASATDNLANMELVNPDWCERSSSPYPSSENDWEASDHSDTDADHSDSSDDDNPTSQVDRLIERGARLIMDGENSNLSSETEDSDDSDFDDDSDSDITDVSPLMSNSTSPLCLSPVPPRRSFLPSGSIKPPFERHYSCDGDTEEFDDISKSPADSEWSSHEDLMNQHHTRDHIPADPTDMHRVVEALLKMRLQKSQQSQDSKIDNHHHNQQHHRRTAHHNIRRHSFISAALQANPHHRHLNKTQSKRKNMTFTNDEIRTIDRSNKILLDKLMTSNNRNKDRYYNEAYIKSKSSKQPSSTVNRHRNEDITSKQNLAILRRLQEAKASDDVIASRPSKHHHRPHYHRTCSATARHSTFSAHHHHSPKQTTH